MAYVVHDEGTFASSDGTEIFYQHWSVPEARAVLVVAHGLGEHSGRYTNVVEHLNPLGFSIWALDHRGHGKSGGKRGHVDAFSQFLEDLKGFFDLVRNREPSEKIFLLGHSLGGLIALSYALRHPEGLTGVVSSSAALKMKLEVPKLKAALGRKLSELLPKLTLGNEIDPGLLTHDSRVVKEYTEDPLVHDKVSTRFFTEFMSQMNWACEHAGEMKIPCLILHAGDDQLVAPEGSSEFFESVQIDDKELQVYEGFYHEIFNELKKEEPLGHLSRWLSDRI